ncbi:O-acetyl-ADP-ribose deacetylase [Candidatus Aerophobetes bacterium]|nr:O-acetyl-ADP-ribose deacetylase [Candidatus Aerophobetes bacterium]
MIRKKIGKSYLELVQGNITEQDTEAIVNAANERLAPGGGVAGAIHRAAGPSLWEECKKLGGCKTGEAKLTSGHNLRATYVIHTVGPVYSGRDKDSEDLKNSYKNSLKLATEKNIRSVSFPSISTGAFGYPVDEAARIALETVVEYLKKDGVELVRFVLFGKKDFSVYQQTLQKIGTEGRI